MREAFYERAFRRFYRGLGDHRDIFYMVFSRGLLHWAERTSAMIPREVNLVLVGIDLDEQERAWVREHIARPCFHVPGPADDQTVWELLFRVNERNFGWVDVDLFVLKEGVFAAMARIDEDVCLNVAWTYRSPHGRDILSTHFVFVNVAAIRALRWRGYDVSPCVYSFDGSPRGRFFANAYTHIPSTRMVRLLRRVLPCDSRGRPLYPSDFPAKLHFRGFDTLVMFQLVSEACGYRLHKVRDLLGVPGTRGHYSEELIHVAAISYYQIFANSMDEQLARYYRALLQLDFLVLSRRPASVPFPSSYERKAREIEAEFGRVGLVPGRAEENITQFFLSMGLDESVFRSDKWQGLWSGQRGRLEGRL